MVDEDIQNITEKFHQDCNVYLKDIYTNIYFQEAYYADSQGSIVVENDNEELLGFAFTGIKHPNDLLHKINVGYIGYNTLPPIIFNRELEDIYLDLWGYCIKSLKKRNVDIIKFLIASDRSPQDTNPEIMKNIKKLNFKTKIIHDKIYKILNKDFYYIILNLNIENKTKEKIKYKIRFLHDFEIPNLIEMYDKNFDPLETHCNPSEIKAKLRINQNSILVAEMNDEIIGCIFAPVYGKISELQGLVVNEKYRGIGVGTELTKSAINQFIDKKVTTIITGISANNIFAYKLLKNLNFNTTNSNTWFFYKEMN